MQMKSQANESQSQSQSESREREREKERKQDRYIGGWTERWRRIEISAALSGHAIKNGRKVQATDGSISGRSIWGHKKKRTTEKKKQVEEKTVDD